MPGSAVKNVEDIYALSSLQQRMLVRALAAPHQGALVEQLTCTLQGDLDAAALRRAWQTVVARHPALRTALVWEGLKKPLQIVRRQVTVPWHEEDLGALPPKQRQRQCQAILAAQREKPFQLTRAPLMRLALVRIDHRRYQFAWTCHHLVTDGWCLGLVLGEVIECYEAFRRGGEPQLPPARPFRDYIAWLQKQDSRDAEAFWQQYLAGFSKPVALPLPRPRPMDVVAERPFQEVCVELSETTTVRLAGHAAARRLPTSTWVEGAWALLLARYSGQDDVVFGITVSGRPSDLPGAESIVGPFINNVPVRVRAAQQGSAVSWLAALQASKTDVQTYAHCPLEEIHRVSAIPEGGRLFETLVVFENYPLDTERLRRRSSLEIEQIRGTATAHFPMALIAVPGRRLALRLQYDTRRFAAWVAEALLAQLCSLIEQLTADPGASLADLPLDRSAGPFGFDERNVVSSYVPGPTEDARRQKLSAGRQPAQGQDTTSAPPQAMIVDSWGHPAPLGMPGELVLRRATAGERLPGCEEPATDEPAVRHDRARWMRTGGCWRRLPGGRIEYLGRTDDPVQLEGYRIDPDEMGSVLAAHPLVRDAAVVARRDPAGQVRLAAYIVPADESRTLLDPDRHALLIDRLRRWLAERFPQAVVPGSLVALEEIPRAAGGEVDLDALPPPARPRPEEAGPPVAPRDPIEAQLAMIWSELLGVHPVGITDHFMELGGDSALAISLFSRIEDHFQRKLPLVSLFHEPTIEYLASLLRRPEEGEGQSTLVPLRPGGDRLPLYCVHPAGGTVFCYLELARHLDQGRAVYGLQARGIDGRLPPHTSVEEMAEHYGQVIRRHQPQGPYALCGWSTGGIIAFELARQLHAQGQKVSTLALFDAAIPDPDRQTFDGSDLLPLLSMLFPGEPEERLRQLQDATSEEQLEYFRHRAELAQLVVAGAAAGQTQNVYEVFQANMEAIIHYRPQPYPGDIVLFRATESATPMHGDPQLGWGRWVAAVEVYEVPGSHLSIFRPPAIRTLARQLDACLRSRSGAP
ncbi:MAG TPA: hypothetical protein EYH34_09000 [Planctomycetes bacterium]|nr:hypothetical protein [Planctomycetota bacterium]